MADIEALNYDDLDTVAKLQKSQRFHDIMVVGIPLFLLVLHKISLYTVITSEIHDKIHLS